MQESMQTSHGRLLRAKLLQTASCAALLVTLSLSHKAKAEDISVPTVWIDLGGAFDQMNHDETGWSPPNLTPPLSKPQPQPFGRVPDVGYDFYAAASLEPENSTWIYTASVRYGRAKLGPKHSHDQSYALKTTLNGQKYVLSNYDFANAMQQSHSSHAIVDFSVGKDIGLGTFNGGKSTVHFGVRIAQVNERSDASLLAFTSAPAKYSPNVVVHKADAVIARGFAGAGPSIMWDAAAPILGSLNDGVSFDWGANAAILFGRQKSHLTLHTKNIHYYSYYHPTANKVLSQSTQAPFRRKSAVVPNAGGFAGLSWHLPNVKVSVGYRADFFFGAIDGGLMTSQKDMRGFYGPFANVSVGIGG